MSLNDTQVKNESSTIFNMINKAKEKGNRFIKIYGGLSLGDASRLESEGYNYVTKRAIQENKFETIISW